MSTISTPPEGCRPSAFIRHLFSRLPRFLAVAVIGFACLSTLSPVALAQGLQSFLKLDGVEGDSVAKGFEGAIDILGFTSGVQIETDGVGGAGNGKPEFFQIVVSKSVDGTSPQLMVSCATAKQFKTATLSTTKASGSVLKTFFKVILTDAIVTKVETTVSSGSSDKVTEYLELSFSKIQWTVRTTNSKGEIVITHGGYDLKTGTKF